MKLPPQVALAILATNDAPPRERRRALLGAWAQSLPAAVAACCRAGAHRSKESRDRKAAIEEVLGCVPVAVVDEIEKAARVWWKRSIILPPDPIAIRGLGSVPRRAVVRELERLYRLAKFRRCSHSHKAVLEYGAPRLDSSTGRMSSEDAGMGRAYCRQQYTVATSRHVLVADERIFRTRRDERVGYDWLQLTPDLRVAQGRGSSLVLQIRGPRGGWKAR